MVIEQQLLSRKTPELFKSATICNIGECDFPKWETKGERQKTKYLKTKLLSPECECLIFLLVRFVFLNL